MNINKIVDLALKLRNRFDNVYSLLKEYDIEIFYKPLGTNCLACTIKCLDSNVILINSNKDIKDFEKNFIIAHEIAHILLHDEIIRKYTNTVFIKTKKEETEADLFSTIFLGCDYTVSCYNLQERINYICGILASNQVGIVIDRDCI